ncbi:VanZ family protein [Paenibacillus sp. BSR1-1]|uniref:VanZ family protein n=1 Tax=Paenibacillus sp. BSR1-1 TaxID=3020845 RepID=UPI0025B22412|nr:VanZ family protein [Paenibacillus sp. BSR1-1]MDN3018989.1 VanZ family protein [Paenibacillus sp. BSR1-1]
MRVIFILSWTLLIFVFTCTANFSELMASGAVYFEWDAHPQFTELLEPLPVSINMGFIIQKVGHLTAFFILALLLQTKVHSKFEVFIFAASYAILTEFLQLYFTRDGRLFDIGIDSAGILLSIAIGSFVNARNSKEISHS